MDRGFVYTLATTLSRILTNTLTSASLQVPQAQRFSLLFLTFWLGSRLKGHQLEDILEGSRYETLAIVLLAS